MPSTSVQEDMAEVLVKARALIAAPERWCKGAPRRGGGVCLLEAIHVAAFSNPGLGNEAARAIGEAAGERFPARFNDAPNTTHADVLAAFDLAISSAVRRGNPK